MHKTQAPDRPGEFISFTVSPNICAPSQHNLHSVTLLETRILRWLLDLLQNLCPLALDTWCYSTWITAQSPPSKLVRIHHSRFTSVVNEACIKTFDTYILQPTSHFPWSSWAKLKYAVLITLIWHVTMCFGRYRVRMRYWPSSVASVIVQFSMKHLQNKPHSDTRGTDTFVKLATSVVMTRNVTSHCIH
jgi:hypothetical protein